MKITKFDIFESKNTNKNTQGMGNVKSPQPNNKPGELPSEKNKKNEGVKSFSDFFQLNEEGGVASATAGNTAGMGAVVAPTVASIPGDVSGSVAGSGDLPAYSPTVMKKDLPKKKKKNAKKNVKSWDDFMGKIDETFSYDVKVEGDFDKKSIKIKNKTFKVGDKFSFKGIGKWKNGDDKVAHYLGRKDDEIIFDLGKKGTKYIITKKELITKLDEKS